MARCTRQFRCLAVCVLGCFAIASSGCRQSARPEPDSAASPSADEILARMIRVYRAASSYSDHGLVRLKYRQGGQSFQDEGQLEVKFSRPNRLQLRAYQLAMASDGQELRALVSDRESGDLDRQVLTRPADSPLLLESLYEDDVVRGVVSGGLGGPPVQLELLLTESPLQYVFDPQVNRELLDAEFLGDRDCHRVRVSLAEGDLVFWIDQQDFVLRRLEYPAARLAAQMAKASECSEVSLVAEFRSARINTSLDDNEFRLDLPENAQLVRRFVLPPPPLPSNLLGNPSGDFFFTDLQGERVTRDSLLGKISVLVWFNNHPASQSSLEQLAQVQAEFAKESGVTFHAICTEPQTLSTAQVQELTRRWGVSMRVVRDLQAFGRDAFQVPWAPTLVILDQRGLVQLFEVGANPTQRQNLSAVLQQLLKGENVAAKMLDQVAQERLAYQKSLAEAASASRTSAARQ
ncbi:MAG: redoxin domain-containing protein [Planctomycetota bacterium]|nr:redoxin domain-containing protein [Planctomycetota bacterium]